MPSPERATPDYRRQTGLVPGEIQRAGVAVLGCGATGSWTAVMLAKMGFGNLLLVDADTVENHNLPAQLYSPEPGMLKVQALRKVIRRLVPSVAAGVEAVPRMVDEGNVDGLLEGRRFVFSCIDTVEGRRIVGKAVDRRRGKGQEVSLVDFRMAPEGGQALFSPGLTIEEFLASLDVEFYEAGECGARALTPAVGGLVGSALTLWLAAARGARRKGWPRRVMWNFKGVFSQEVEDVERHSGD